jgi:cytochrome c biogenesis protein CcmG, thiol:disulfide interchange protein DsbE
MCDGEPKGEKARLREERLARGGEAESERERERRMKLGGIGVFFVLVAIAVGASLILGSSDERGSDQPALSPQEIAAAPQHLRANLNQANQLIDDSIESKLDELRGVPVVVNQWASWCVSCRAEFPFFQKLARQYADRVAFVGLDSQDDRGAAEDFLKQYPVPYPSIYDPSASEAASIGAGQGWPTTVFIGKRGASTHIRPGGYATQQQLRADIQQYALASG